MSAKQDNSPNRIDTKRLTLYALLVAAAMVFSYIESLVPLFFIAPGVKIGLANAVSLLLAAKGRYKGAFAVNISRILLSALLFGSAVSLAYMIIYKQRHYSVLSAPYTGGIDPRDIPDDDDLVDPAMKIVKDILSIGIPIATGACILALLNSVDSKLCMTWCSLPRRYCFSAAVCFIMRLLWWFRE